MTSANEGDDRLSAALDKIRSRIISKDFFNPLWTAVEERRTELRPRWGIPGDERPNLTTAILIDEQVFESLQPKVAELLHEHFGTISPITAKDICRTFTQQLSGRERTDDEFADSLARTFEFLFLKIAPDEAEVVSEESYPIGTFAKEEDADVEGREIWH